MSRRLGHIDQEFLNEGEKVEVVSIPFQGFLELFNVGKLY